MKSQISFQNQKRNNILPDLFFFLSPLVIFIIQENSMKPVLSPGDQILVSKIYHILPGDIVVVKNPLQDEDTQYLVKQVSNVKKNKIFIEGINTKESIDSNSFGWISKSSIVGKMIKKL